MGGGANVVSENAQHCRRKAAACWRTASRTRDPQRRRELEELALAWMRLADRAEHEPDWRVLFINKGKLNDE
jgi:TorA maturation chaperone TorD